MSPSPCQDGILLGAVGAYDWTGAVLKDTGAGKLIPVQDSYLQEFPKELRNHGAYLGEIRRCGLRAGLTACLALISGHFSQGGPPMVKGKNCLALPFTPLSPSPAGGLPRPAHFSCARVHGHVRRVLQAGPGVRGRSPPVQPHRQSHIVHYAQ